MQLRKRSRGNAARNCMKRPRGYAVICRCLCGSGTDSPEAGEAVQHAQDGCEHVRVASITRDIEAVVRSAWARDTCDPVDAGDWSAANPARGQCGTTALVINDLLGGELLMAEVVRADGNRQGVHWWNRLPDGTEIDLTREQFASHELIQQPRVVPRPPGLPKRAAEQYLTLKHRVLHALGLTQTSDIR